MRKGKKSFMQIALELAQQAAKNGEVPVGAVLVRNGDIIAESGNQMRKLGDCTAHAEMIVIRQALASEKITRLSDCDLYVTLEPCTMCAGAISHAKIRRLYYGAEDIKGGAVENGVRFFYTKTCHHRPEVIVGVEEEEAEKLLKSFFVSLR